MKKNVSMSFLAVQLAKNCLYLKLGTLKVLRFCSIGLVIFLLQACFNHNNEQTRIESKKIKPIEGIKMPESAYTMRDGRIIVSEIGEFGKNGDGKILEVLTDGSLKVIADSGLNDPKGLLVEGPTIYVTDNEMTDMFGYLNRSDTLKVEQAMQKMSQIVKYIVLLKKCT